MTSWFFRRVQAADYTWSADCRHGDGDGGDDGDYGDGDDGDDDGEYYRNNGDHDVGETGVILAVLMMMRTSRIQV